MKKVLKACIKQILQFDSEVEYECFLKKIIGGYAVVSKEVTDGKVVVEINRSYNNNELIMD